MIAALLPLVVLSASIGIAWLRHQQEAIEDEASDHVQRIAILLERELAAQIDVLRTLAVSPLLDGEIDEASRVEGRVVLSEGARISGSVVRGPAVIGPGACIEDSFIGPYTSVGDDVHVRRSEVEHSILLAGSVVEDLGTRMEASLLGRNVKLTRSNGMPKTFRLLVGDNSEIELL